VHKFSVKYFTQEERIPSVGPKKTLLPILDIAVRRRRDHGGLLQGVARLGSNEIKRFAGEGDVESLVGPLYLVRRWKTIALKATPPSEFMPGTWK